MSDQSQNRDVYVHRDADDEGYKVHVASDRNNVFHFQHAGKCSVITVDIEYSRRHHREDEPLVSITGCSEHNVHEPSTAYEASSVYKAFLEAHHDDIEALFAIVD